MTLEVGIEEYLQFKNYKNPLKFEKTVITVPFKPMTESSAKNMQKEREEAVKGEIFSRLDNLRQQAEKAGIPEEAIMFAGHDDKELLDILRSAKINGKTLTYYIDGMKFQTTYGNHRIVYVVDFNNTYEGEVIPDKIVIDDPKNGKKLVQTYIGKYMCGEDEIPNAYKTEYFTKTPNGTYREVSICNEYGYKYTDYCLKFFNPQGKEISEEEYNNAIINNLRPKE